jgi:anti-sigma regulatory factor (Ser/Thr protein kinase)
VLDQVRRTHTHVVTVDGHRLPSTTYQNPRDFLATAVTPWVEPIESRPPTFELSDPSSAQARNALGALQETAVLTDEDLNGLVLSVSEAVSNALVHGCPPVRLRAWAESGRIVVTVTDRGPGPADPAAGLMPGAGPGGLGLWLAYQLCAYVSLQREPDGYTIRLIAGEPTA